ncbi:hypothetical protein JCM18237_28200 [Halorubrum luteum]
MTDSNSQNVVRKKFSLTEYHNRLLEELVELRYASRSEGVRAAIQHHYRYVSDGGETKIESVSDDVDQVLREVKYIDEKLDERDSVVHIASQVSEEVEMNQESGSNSKIKKRITEELSKSDSLGVDEIVKKTEQDWLSVIPAIDSMKEEGTIRPVADDAYELNT